MLLKDNDVLRYYAAYAQRSEARAQKKYAETKSDDEQDGESCSSPPDFIAGFYRDLERDVIEENTVLRTLLTPEDPSLFAREKAVGLPAWEPFLIDMDKNGVPSLNDSQLSAIRTALTNPLSVIKGPPGTGKTRTIINLMSCIIGLGKTVAMVSFNNDAVKNVSDKIESCASDPSENTAQLYRSFAPMGRKAMRKAFYQSEKFKRIKKEAAAWKSFGFILKKKKDGKSKLTEVKPPSALFLSSFPAVTTTIHSMGHLFRDTNRYRFDYVIMDESSQTRPDIGIVAAAMCDHLVLVGDEFQLPSFCDHQILDGMEKGDVALPADSIYRMRDESGDVSFFDIALKVIKDKLQRPELITLLNVHYRCHPGIIGFCNREIYEKKGGEALRIATADYDTTTDCPIRVRYYSGDYKEGCFMKNGDSKRNLRQIEIFKAQELDGLIEKANAGKSICVLTPFRGQLQHIRDLLKNRLSGVEIGGTLTESDDAFAEDGFALTIHKSQGMEFDSVYLLPVEDGNWEWPWSQKMRLINVAVSRAKEELIIIASTTMMEEHIQLELCGYSVPRSTNKSEKVSKNKTDEMYLQKLLSYVYEKTKNTSDSRYGFHDSLFRSVFDEIPTVYAWINSSPQIKKMLTKPDQQKNGDDIMISTSELSLYGALKAALDDKIYRICYDVPLKELIKDFRPEDQVQTNLLQSGSCDFVICRRSDGAVLAVIEVMGKPHRHIDTVGKREENAAFETRKADVADNILRDAVKRSILEQYFAKNRILFWTTDGVRLQNNEIEFLTRRTDNKKGILISSPRKALCPDLSNDGTDLLYKAWKAYQSWKETLPHSAHET